MADILENENDHQLRIEFLNNMKKKASKSASDSRKKKSQAVALVQPVAIDQFINNNNENNNENSTQNDNNDEQYADNDENSEGEEENIETYQSLFHYQDMINLISSDDLDSGDYNYAEEFSTNLDTPTNIYAGSKVTTAEFYLAFDAIISKHHINSKAATDILKLFKAVLPQPCCLKKPKYSNILQPIVNQLCLECKTTLIHESDKININKVYYCVTCKNELMHFVTFRFLNIFLIMNI